MFVALVLVTLLDASATSIRGVNPKDMKLFTGSQFICRDGTQSFPISVVNDDYCDCDDGSDEPGTSACSNGFFYCPNKGFKGSTIASSRVDDGLCDCCDGSDEKSGKCTNNCSELGAHLLLESRRKRKEQAIGYQVRMGWSNDGKAAKVKRAKNIEVLKSEVDKKRADMEERENYKNELEKPAIEAKEAAKAVFDKEEEERIAVIIEENRLQAEAEFHKIDENQDSSISPEEISNYGNMETAILPFDDIQLLAESGEIDSIQLLQQLQDRIAADREAEEKRVYEEERAKVKRAKKPKLKPVENEAPVEPQEEEEMWGEDGQRIVKEKEMSPKLDEEDEEDEEEMEEEEEDVKPVRNTLKYDADTQRLIDVFEEADRIYRGAKEEFDAAKRQLEDLEKIDNIDFGPDEEYYPLYRECFTLREEKYMYRLCLFDKTDQDGTSLGRFEGWQDNYTKMKYTNGQNCWNGPNRSTVVQIECGPENEVVAASEPAKCEYAFVFKTPAGCTRIQEEHELHDEL